VTSHRAEPIAVHAEALTRCFDDPHRDDTTVAVDQLTLSVHHGEVFGLLGHNGAGKTTTIRMLNGVLAPTRGKLRVLGYDPTEEGAILRRHTGVLTETPSLDEKLTAWENLTIYGRLYGVDELDLRARVGDLLEDFELDTRAREMVGAYSKGMKQRLALARALLHRPSLIFLDEPTGGLDPVATRQVHALITRLSRRGGHTFVLCTHNLLEAQRLCHRVAVMEHGRLVAVGEPATLARDLWQGVRLEIELDPGPLTGVPLPPEVRDLAWDEEGHVLSLWLPQRDDVPDLVAALVNAGRRIYQVAPQEPTLEDVYFALHEASLGEEGA